MSWLDDRRRTVRHDHRSVAEQSPIELEGIADCLLFTELDEGMLHRSAGIASHSDVLHLLDSGRETINGYVMVVGNEINDPHSSHSP